MSEICRKILCVDDDRNLLEGMKRQFRKQLEITTAVGPEEGLKTLEQSGPFAVVVSDFAMPGMNGVQFLQEVGRRSPDTILVMLTGHADLNVAVSALHDGNIFRFLNKPCPAPVFDKTIRDCLDQYRLIVTERLLTEQLNKANADLQALNEQLERRVAARTATIRRINQFVTDLSRMDTMHDVAEQVVRTAAEMLNSRRVSLMMPDTSGEYLRVVAAIGMADAVKARVRVPVGASISGMVFAESRSIVVNKPGALPGEAARYDTEVFASLPLAAALLATTSRPVGVLNVTEPAEGRFYDDESMALLQTISEAASIAISNQIRLQERNEARDAIILALAKLAEHRDPETGAHLERVQNYCRLVCEVLAETDKYRETIDSKFIECIVRSSPLHDIGKVGVPDQILLKPGKLTSEEFETMKRHAPIGGDTIRVLFERNRRQRFLEMGMQIAYHHHERYDGKGYPAGLQGEAVPLAARIVALADVYDALRSRRVYKPSMPHGQAAELVKAGAGTQFDPDVVAAFSAREAEFERLASELGDDFTFEPPDAVELGISAAPAPA